jgi:uncharacterized membrane protein
MSKKEASSNVYNVLAFNFAGKDTAKETVKDLRASDAFDDQYVVAQIIVEQDEKGKVHIHETGRGGLGAVVGGVAGSLLSLIGGPVGFLTWVVGGAVIGGVAGKYLGRPIKKGDLKEVGKAMVPDSSAFLLLVEDTYTEEVADSLSGVSTDMVTLTVGDELSGELAQFVAAQASADDDATDDDE